MTDLNSLLERAERAVSGVPLPGGGVERLRSLRDRKRRNQRIAAGVVGITVFVASVWIVTTGGPFDRTQRPATSGPAPAPPSPSVTDPGPYAESGRVGFIGLPPEGATPSTPESGELVLSLWGNTETTPRGRVWVYADGRLIWSREANLPYGANDRSTGFLEQHLTPEGVELLRSEIVSSGLFGSDLDLADRRVIGAASDSALGRLVTRLLDPESWLPTSAWEDREIRAYVPSSYQVCYGGPPHPPTERSRILSLLPAPAADLLRTKEGILAELDGPEGFYCSDVTTEEARALAQAFDDAGFGQGMGNVWTLEYQLDAPFGPGHTVDIFFEPYLPHGKVTCSACG